MPSIDGYFSENLVNVVIVTVTYDLPSYSVWRMGVFVSTDNTTGPSPGIDLEKDIHVTFGHIRCITVPF